MANRAEAGIETKFRFSLFEDEHFVDLNLFQFGWEKCHHLHRAGPAVRHHYLFHYVIAGKGYLDGNGETFPIHAGQGFMIFPGQINTYYVDPEDPWEYFWLEFDGLRARETVAKAGLTISAPVFTPVKSEEGAEVQRLIEYIVNNPNDSPMRLVGYAMILLDQIVRASRKKVVQGSRRLRDFYMREALAYIDGNYQRDISVEELAAFCGLNRSYFTRLFKDVMGLPPQQFIMQYRMAKAADILKNSRLPIAEVSASVGYDNQLHFSRAFKSVHGVSPREYRQTHFVADENKKR